MKQTLITMLLVGITCTGMKAQEPIIQNVIEIKGKASMIMEPDQIVYQITLWNDYWNIFADSETSIESEEDPENLLKEIFARNGYTFEASLPDKDYAVTPYDYGVDEETTSYKVKVSSLSELDPLVAELRNHSCFIGEILEQTCSGKAGIIQQLKLEAVRDAKNQAEKMLNALGAKIGKVVHITEGTIRDGSPKSLFEVMISYDDESPAAAGKTTYEVEMLVTFLIQ